MAKKNLVFNEEARKGLEAGVNKLADVVKVTLHVAKNKCHKWISSKYIYSAKMMDVTNVTLQQAKNLF